MTWWTTTGIDNDIPCMKYVDTLCCKTQASLSCGFQSYQSLDLERGAVHEIVPTSRLRFDVTSSPTCISIPRYLHTLTILHNFSPVSKLDSNLVEFDCCNTCIDLVCIMFERTYKEPDHNF